MAAWLPPTVRNIAAAVIFVASYFVFAAGRLPGTRIRRAGMALIGGALMVAVGALPGWSAIHAVEFPTLVLLLAMMIVAAGLHLAGLFDWIAAFVAARVPPDSLLPAVILTSGVLSAFLVNDVVCLVLTPLLLPIAKAMRRDPVPYLLALATASNIGSLATITGNPQDILIASVSGIGYVRYLAHLAPVAAIGLCVDWALLRWLERPMAAAAASGGSGRLPFVGARGAAAQPPEPARKASAAPGTSPAAGRGTVPALVVLGLVVAGFLAGVPPAWAAAFGAVLLLVLCRRRIRDFYREVDWGLLLLFIGLFLIIGGARNSGLLGWLAQWTRGPRLHNTAVFTAFTAVLANIVSNVPAVMLLKAPVAHLAHAQKYWLLLAMSSTLAGNLTLTGSIANFIVVERARPEARVGFWRYLRIGLPVGVATIAIGYGLLQMGL